MLQAQLTHRDEHQWFWYPQLRQDEALLFAQIDPRENWATHCFHTAFVDPDVTTEGRASPHATPIRTPSHALAAATMATRLHAPTRPDPAARCRVLIDGGVRAAPRHNVEVRLLCAWPKGESEAAKL